MLAGPSFWNVLPRISGSPTTIELCSDDTFCTRPPVFIMAMLYPALLYNTVTLTKASRPSKPRSSILPVYSRLQSAQYFVTCL